MAPRVLIKIGGAALTDESTLSSATQLIQKLQSQGQQVIVLHGGGPAINEALTRNGISWNFHNGQRVTSQEMLPVIDHVLSQQVNGHLVNHFVTAGLPAQGLSGAAQGILMCEQLSPELGYVGQVVDVRTAQLEALLSSGTTLPVVAPVGIDSQGQLYNINADWAAGFLAVALKVESLIYLTDQDGVWDENKKIIQDLSSSQIEKWIQQNVVQGGMLTKMRSVLYVLSNGLSSVHILSGKKSHLFPTYAGTRCTPSLSEVVTHASI